jgi:hypothetical protein
VLEKSRPKVREGVAKVTMGSPSKLPLGFHFVLVTFTHMCESSVGNNYIMQMNNFFHMYIYINVCDINNAQ